MPETFPDRETTLRRCCPTPNSPRCTWRVTAWGLGSTANLEVGFHADDETIWIGLNWWFPEMMGPPKSSILKGFSLQIIHLGVPLFMETSKLTLVLDENGGWMTLNVQIIECYHRIWTFFIVATVQSRCWLIIVRVLLANTLSSGL